MPGLPYSFDLQAKRHYLVSLSAHDLSSLRTSLRRRNKCKRPKTGDVCRLQRSKHRVLEQSRTNSFTLPRNCDGETRQQHNRHRMTGQTFRQAFGSVVIVNLPDDKRGIPNDLLI